MLSLFRSKPPTIPSHESRVSDLTKQVADCERDLQAAEARSVDAAIEGHGLAELINEVVRLSAELSALKTARSKVEAELADLRAAAAEAEAARRKAEAQTQMLDLVSEMERTAEQAKPYLHRVSARCKPPTAGWRRLPPKT